VQVMGRQERYWERPRGHDGEVSGSAMLAISVAFLLVQLLTIVALGLSALTMLIGFVIGSVVIVTLVKLVVANQRPVREPPRDLL
jgi:hypothetical protein